MRELADNAEEEELASVSYVAADRNPPILAKQST